MQGRGKLGPATSITQRPKHVGALLNPAGDMLRRKALLRRGTCAAVRSIKHPTAIYINGSPSLCRYQLQLEPTMVTASAYPPPSLASVEQICRWGGHRRGLDNAAGVWSGAAPEHLLCSMLWCDAASFPQAGCGTPFGTIGALDMGAFDMGTAFDNMAAFDIWQHLPHSHALDPALD